jgi:hypothetical protein
VADEQRQNDRLGPETDVRARVSLFNRSLGEERSACSWMARHLENTLYRRRPSSRRPPPSSEQHFADKDECRSRQRSEQYETRRLRPRRKACELTRDEVEIIRNRSEVVAGEIGLAQGQRVFVGHGRFLPD